MRGCCGSERTHTHRDRQSKYSNPHCACAPRVNQGVCIAVTLAFCTLLGQDLSDVKFNEDVMRKQLESCFDKKHLTTFPKL